MIPDAILNASGAATAACLVSDTVVYAIQQAQRERSGLPLEAIGIIGRIFLSLAFNFVLCFTFAYTYHAVALGSGRAFLAGGVAWLAVVIPVLMTSHSYDDRQKAVLTTRIFGWLFKTAAACAAIDYFIG
jgi:uncharacterized membrane protein YagU involved in acid resistance